MKTALLQVHLPEEQKIAIRLEAVRLRKSLKQLIGELINDFLDKQGLESGKAQQHG